MWKNNSRKINEEVTNRMYEYVKTSERHKLIDFVIKHVTTEIDYSNQNPKIKCPFHAGDNGASCYIRLEINGFKCFGCGEGGSYFKFMMLYNKKYNNIDRDFYTTMDRILMEDDRMKLDIGTNTIYMESTLTIDEIVDMPAPRFIPRKERTLDSLLELNRWMAKSGHMDYDSIKIAVISAQQGLRPEEIRSVILGEVRNDIVLPDMSGINLDDLLFKFEVEM